MNFKRLKILAWKAKISIKQMELYSHSQIEWSPPVVHRAGESDPPHLEPLFLLVIPKNFKVKPICS